MKRLLLSAIAAFMCVIMVSCSPAVTFGSDDRTTAGTDGTDGTDTSIQDSAPPVPDRLKTASERADAALESVKREDFKGMSFIVTCTSVDKMFGDDESFTTLSREKYLRSEKLAERLNVNFIQTEADGDAIYEGLKKESEADVVYSHLLLVDASDVGTLSYNKLVGNIGSLPFVDLTKEYYDADFCEKMSTPTGVWGVYGDACKDYGSLGCILYNENLRIKLGIDELEVGIKEKSWTYDKLTEYAKLAASSQEDGTGFGVVCGDTSEFFRYAFVSAQMDSVRLSGKELVLNDNTELGDELVRCVRGLFASESYYTGGEEKKDARQTFFDGQGLFFVTELSSVEKIYNMKDVWGLMPLPSVKAGEEYNAPMSADTSVICFPASATDTDLVGIMVESLFASSYEILDAAFFDTYLHHYVRNEKTLDTLLVLMDGNTTDFAVCYADEFDNYNKGAFGAFEESCLGDELYSAIFKRNKTAAQRSLRYVK